MRYKLLTLYQNKNKEEEVLTVNEEEEELLRLLGQISDTVEGVAEAFAETKLEPLKPVLLELLQIQRILQARLRKVVVQQMRIALTAKY